MGTTVVVSVCSAMLLSIFVYWKKICKKKKSKELLIFSRYPTPGSTKTRLIPSLGDEGASYAQLLMTDHILSNIEQYCTKDKDLATILCYNGGTKQQMRHWLDRRKCDVSWQAQSPGGLGEKLASAFKSSFKSGSNYTIIIGSDIPGINAAIITEAYKKLQNGADMVLGPAADGGYYLVGISKSQSQKLDVVFSDIKWGTDTVFKEQSEQATSQGMSLEVLTTVLNDVDLPEDIPVMEKALQISVSDITCPKISIVIPVFNEADNILSTLQTVVQKCSENRSLADIIVSDGGSTDDTVKIVQTFARSTDIEVKVVNSEPGRGFQQRYGAEIAKGNILMFLHADTVIPKNFDIFAISCLRIPGNVAGSFRFSLDLLEFPEKANDLSKWFVWKMKLIKQFANRRTQKYEFPYGDQILFTTRKNYDKVGGFDQVYLMEDFMLVEKLRKIGHVALADGDPAITSARRWQKWGMKITLMNNLIVMAYKLGVSPNRLAEFYYGDKLKEKKNIQRNPEHLISSYQCMTDLYVSNKAI